MRQRATSVIIKNGKVVLVREKGKHQFSLPGGGIKKGEPTVSAAAREVYEELSLHVVNVKRLRYCDLKGSFSYHKVCLIEVTGEPHIREELDKFIWWDMKESIAVFDHVTKILEKIKEDKSWGLKVERM